MKNFKIEVKWAVRFSFALLLWMFFEKSIGLHDELIAKHAIYTNLFGIIAIIIYVFALKDKKQYFYNGTMNWKQGFISGIVISVFVAILSPITQYIISTYITPDYFNNVIDFVVENEKMTRENAEGYFNLKSYMLQSAFGSLAMGVVTSAAVAFFVKSNNRVT
ncbi:DUF4199 domain-containing protein [Aurantibacter crassamenti]|uniref:DUF4199 domain-containing protein n=1 Tax=Aurantibacter crassamenti TaxID=1837375 RepID=UPI00193AD873|nr:DUF4199 domain-containing protein [Aurantibacter crassamenti]MBM1105047.1 DUF4199 domain-containing protein [Aurantibacter crassamenti]